MESGIPPSDSTSSVPDVDNINSSSNASTMDILNFLSQLGSESKTSTVDISSSSFKTPTADISSSSFLSSLPVSTVFPFFMPMEMVSSSALPHSSRPSTTPTLDSSDTLMASSSVTPSPRDNHMDVASCTSAYKSYHHCLEQQQMGDPGSASNGTRNIDVSNSFSDANLPAALTNTSVIANIASNDIFGSMPMLSSQPQQYHAQQQASTFPALANSPLQGSSSSFTLLNSSEPMDITPPPLQPHSTTQPDLFAQTIAFPADINIATRPGGARVLRRRSHAGPSNGAFRRASSPGSSSRSHPYMPQIQQPSSAAAPLSSPFGILPSDPLALRRSNSIATLTPYVSTQQAVTRRPQKTTSSTFIIPAINQDGTCKRCANCYTAETPSWRRHPDTQELLCNACGLYLRLHRKARPITIDESGNIQVVRKNAAIQREPINLRVAPFGQTQVLDPPNGRGYQQYSAPNGTMGLQLTSPVHSMDGVHDISSPFSAMHVDHYSLTQTPTYSVSNNAAGQQASVARFSVDDILQPRALRSEAGGSHQNTNENTSTGGDNDLISNADSSMKHSPSNEP